MKLEEQVLNVEQVKHLQELRLKMNVASHYWYALKRDSQGNIVQKPHWAITLQKSPSHWGTVHLEYIPTYTLQEVLDRLPKSITFNNEKYILEISLNPQASVYYFSVKDDDDYILFKNKELFTALYRMLCWLLENGYLV